MKVRVTLVVDLDAAAWAEYNGVSRAEVPDDVRRHLLTMAQGSTLLEEAGAEVDLASPRTRAGVD